MCAACKRYRYEKYVLNKPDVLERRKKTTREWQIRNREYVNFKANEWEKAQRPKKVFMDKGTRICTSCREEKLFKEFSNNKRLKKTGKFATCKKCVYLKIKTTPLLKLKVMIRSRIAMELKAKNFKKDQRSHIILGCSIEVAKLYIERKFKKGMNWSNHGEWHLDHKIPLGLAKTKEELITLFHYTNLQPLWKTENLRKNNRIIKPIQVILPI